MENKKREHEKGARCYNEFCAVKLRCYLLLHPESLVHDQSRQRGEQTGKDVVAKWTGIGEEGEHPRSFDVPILLVAKEIRYHVDIWKCKRVLHSDVLGVHVGMGKRIENDQWDVNSQESYSNPRNKPSFLSPVIRPKNQNSKGRHSRDQVCSRGQPKEKPAPHPAVFAAFEELAEAEHCKEDADYVPVKKKHEDETRSCDQV